MVIRPFFVKSGNSLIPGLNKSVSISDTIKNMSEKLDQQGDIPRDIQGGSAMFGFGDMGSQTNELKQTLTITPSPTPTQAPTVITEYVQEFVPYLDQELIRFRYSYYYPPLGGVNCHTFENGNCITPMASGDPWEEWLGRAVACSSEYPLGTKIVVVAPEAVKGLWYCLDRGGGIEGTDLLDFLTDHQDLEWLTYVYAYILE